MKKLVAIILSGVLLLTACGSSETISEPETIQSLQEIEESRAEQAKVEETLFLPYTLETVDGNVYLTNVYIWQNEKEHGYSGYVAFEIDLSELDDDQKYWFRKDYRVTLDFSGSNKSKDDSVPINTVWSAKTDEDMIEDKIYLFGIINECKNPLSEYKLRCQIRFVNTSDGTLTIDIDSPTTDFELDDSFPNDVYSYFSRLL